MTRFYLSILSIFAFSLAGFSQLTHIPLKITDNLQKIPSVNRLNKKSNINPKSCGKDTVGYVRTKATAFNSISTRKNYSLGQIYGAPQDITIHGFTFFAWAVANPPTDKKIRLICNLYKAGTDSLPSGSPLASDTVTVDSTFGGGLLSVLEKHATFKSPVTVNFPYVLTVESDSVNVSAGLVANSWSAKDGERENLLCGSVSGKWYRGLSLNISGTPLDADMQFYPHVSYKFGTNFSVPDCFDFKDSARFKNDFRTNVAGSKFYSLYAFYKLDRYTHQWNYGEVPWNFNGEDGINKYSSKGNYKIRLISYIYQWRGNNPCIDTTEKMLYFMPKDPVAISSLNICRGDSANIKVVSDPGAIIKWFRNPADTTPDFTGEYIRFGVPQKSDTFYLQAFNFSCKSGMTKIIISVNDYPKHPVIKNDSICQGARANLEAKSTLGKTEWSKDSTLLPFFTGDVFQTGSLNSDVSFFVRSNNNGCYSPYFKTISAFVDNSFAPSDPIISADTGICLRPLGKAVLKAYSSSNDSLRWFMVPSGGTSIAGGNTFTYTPSAVGTTVIYVESQKSTCASSRLGINVTTGDYPSISKVFNDEKCKGDTSQLAALLSGLGDIQWYNTATGGIPFNSGAAIRLYTIKTKNVYAESSANGCVNPVRSLVTAKINAYDSITRIDVPLVCGNAKVTLKVTAGTNLVKWYEDEAATKLLSSTPSYTTPKLLVSTNYYFTVEKNSCTSPVYTVLAEVLPLPVAGYNYSFITGHKMSLVPSVTTGVTYKWVMGDGNTYTSKYVTHKYALYGTYNVKLIVKTITSGCTDSASQEILFDFSGLKPVDREILKVYPNPTSGNFKITLPQDVVNGNLSIFNPGGQLIYSALLKGAREVFIDEKFAKGVYIIKVEGNGKTSVARLMVN